MNFRLWMLVLGLFMCVPGFAQEGEIDLANLTANRKTFVFNDSKHTVKKYINTQLQDETSCCGENDDRIYLEVRIDPTGYVVSAKAITGKNECFKQSAEDLVKRVKWEANDSRGPKSIYIELRPKVECVSGKDNTYAQLKIFNNKLMDEKGERVQMASGSQEKTDKLVEMVTGTKKTPETLPAEQPAEKPAEKAPETTTTEKVDESKIAAAKDKVEKAPEKVAEKVEVATKEADTKIAEATPMTSTAVETAADPIEVEMTEEEKAAKAKEDADRAVREEEINQLRKQMAELRNKKVEEDALAAKKEKAREARRAKREAYLEKKREALAAKEKGDDTWNDSSNDELDGKTFAEGEEGETGSMSEADRLREEIKRLQDQERTIEEARQLREDEVRRQLDENDRSNQEAIQLAEERLRVEEQLYQVEEQEELDIIEKDRQQVENTRREQENEYQRIMDEVNRLQQEAQLKIQDLERQKADLDGLAAAKQAREQEIMLARATRELEREKQLEMIRLDMVNNSLANNTQSAPRGLSSTIDNDALLNDILPNLTTEADSEKLILLIKQIQLMKDELTILRSQIATMDRSAAGTPAGSVPGVENQPVGTARSAQVDPNVKNAANDDSWKNITITSADVDVNKYIVNRGSTPPPPTKAVPAGGTSPDPSNPDTHDNMEGPKFAPRFYIDGEDAMKDLVKDRLRLGGVCGLAHTVFSVTLDPNGNVAAFNVLTSNNATVQLQMNAIIPTLKFNTIKERFNQTIYQEIKAEILCNGATDKVNLKEVKDLIKKNQ